MSEEMKVNKFDIELDITEASFLLEAIQNALNDTVIDDDRRKSLEKTIEKINEGYRKTLLMF